MFEITGAVMKGFLTTAGLISAIGAQNAFVLTNGIRNNHSLAIAATCSALDILLIVAGIAGMRMLIEQIPGLAYYASIFGAIFLFLYGTLSLRSMFSEQRLATDGKLFQSRKRAILTTLAISLLNPHVYLDTLVLLGSVGSQFGDPGRWWFALGACVASVLWFSSLSIGARLVAPWFTRPMTWKILDGIIWLIMWLLAWSLWQYAHSLPG